MRRQLPLLCLAALLVFTMSFQATAQEVKPKIRITMSDLHRAVFYNDNSLITRLLKGGADVNARASRKVTPLHMAAHEGHVEAARLLIKAGADTNLLNSAKETPLDVAIRKGRADMVDYLFTLTKTDKKHLGYTPMPQEDNDSADKGNTTP